MAFAVIGLLYSFDQLGPPQVVIEEPPAGGGDGGIIDNPPSKTGVGRMTYDLTVNYANGQHRTFTESVAFPEVTFDVFDDANSEITSFDVKGTIRLGLPSDANDYLRQNVDVLNTMTVYLNNSQIGTNTSTRTFTISDFDDRDIVLYQKNIAVSDLPISSGKYSLRFSTIDQVKFYYPDWTEKIMRITANPGFGLDTDSGLHVVDVVTTRPTVTVSLQYNPVQKGYGQDPTTIVGYSKTVVIKATNFLPNSPITFSLDTEAPQYQKNMNQSVWLQGAQTSAPATTDSAGTATARIDINTLTEINCYHYYAKYTVSDGVNTVTGVMGCTVEDWKTATGAYPTR